MFCEIFKHNLASSMYYYYVDFYYCIFIESIFSGPGRKCKVSISTQLEHYHAKSKELLDINGKIKPATDNVYADLSNILGMTTKAIHLAVTKNSGLVFGEEFVLKTNREQLERQNEEKEDDYEFVLCMDLKGSYITIILNANDIKSLDIIEKIGKTNRVSKFLRPGWTDALNGIIKREIKCSCNFNFTAHTLIDKDFKTDSTCVECGAAVNVLSTNGRNKLVVQWHEGEGVKTHTKRRRLSMARAEAFVSELKNDTVHNVHTAHLNELDSSEDLPNDYISKKSLSNLKTRHLGQTRTSINELRVMKYKPEFEGAIKEIGTDPFFVIFWTKSQQYVYSQLYKRGRLILSMDATGGIVSNYGLLADLKECPNKITLPHIFLYLICAKNEAGKSVPVAQMLWRN